MYRPFVLFALCLIIAITSSAAVSSAQENLSVMQTWRNYSGLENTLYNHIAEEAYKYLDQRDETISDLKTEGEWQTYIDSVREKLKTAFGPLPEKTPLNARITDTITHLEFTVEKIIFESRPGFFVSAAFFKRSDSSSRLPAILYLCGHTTDGYKGVYQTPVLNLARKGFAVLAIDPVGQGERVQYTKEENIGGPTNEHSYPGLQYLPLGRTMAMVRLWDGIRAVDYLSSRQDVDVSRIGVVGRSGGGTMSAYLGAMDDRITAAAPTNYITSFRRLLQSIGPQDAEQNLLDEIKLGIDHGDFLLARAPKPTLMIATTNDFFSIQGAKETASTVKQAFEALGAGNNFDFIYDDAGHAPTPLNRKRMYAFFMNTFSVTGDPAEEDIPHIPADRLNSTPNGNVLEAGSRSIHEIIIEDAEPVLERLETSRKNLPSHLKKVRNASLKLSGYDVHEQTSETIMTGRFPRDGYRIETYILESDTAIPVPAAAYIPDGAGPFPAVMAFNQQGKGEESFESLMVLPLVRSGYIVLSGDLPGCGELRYDIPGGDGIKSDDAVVGRISFNVVFGAQLIGKSITGIQAGAVSRSLRYLASRDDVDTSHIHAVSFGTTGPAVMHAAAHETTIQSAVCIESPVSWESVVNQRLYNPAIGATIVPSALTAYDLPDLISLAAPRKVIMISPCIGSGDEAPPQEQRKILEYVRQAYDDPERFRIISGLGSAQSIADFLIRFFE